MNNDIQATDKPWEDVPAGCCSSVCRDSTSVRVTVVVQVELMSCVFVKTDDVTFKVLVFVIART